MKSRDWFWEKADGAQTPFCLDHRAWWITNEVDMNWIHFSICVCHPCTVHAIMSATVKTSDSSSVICSKALLTTYHCARIFHTPVLLQSLWYWAQIMSLISAWSSKKCRIWSSGRISSLHRSTMFSILPAAILGSLTRKPSLMWYWPRPCSASSIGRMMCWMSAASRYWCSRRAKFCSSLNWFVKCRNWVGPSFGSISMASSSSMGSSSSASSWGSVSSSPRPIPEFWWRIRCM